VCPEGDLGSARGPVELHLKEVGKGHVGPPPPVADVPPADVPPADVPPVAALPPFAEVPPFADVPPLFEPPVAALPPLAEAPPLELPPLDVAPPDAVAPPKAPPPPVVAAVPPFDADELPPELVRPPTAEPVVAADRPPTLAPELWEPGVPPVWTALVAPPAFAPPTPAVPPTAEPDVSSSEPLHPSALAASANALLWMSRRHEAGNLRCDWFGRRIVVDMLIVQWLHHHLSIEEST
jgi:hypothetical protein